MSDHEPLEEPPLEIHKPKPWRGFRGFLKEYVIIVVGVLTALGAEQVAENLHWRHLAQQHLSDLREGAQRIAANAYSRRVIDPCIRGELQKTVEALRMPGGAWKGLKPDASGPVFGYLPANLTSSATQWSAAAWDSALNDGSLTHLPPAKVKEYAPLFRTSQDILLEQQLLYDQLPKLTPLAFDRQLSDDARAHYLEIVAQAERTQSLMSSMSDSILRAAAKSDFWPTDSTIQAGLDRARKLRGDCVQPLNKADFLPAPAGR
jgi:hypothetical protein